MIISKLPFWLQVLLQETIISTRHSLRIKQLQKSTRASLVFQLVENLPAMWETWVQSLGWEDLLEKGIATHSSILA